MIKEKRVISIYNPAQNFIIRFLSHAQLISNNT